MAPRAEIWVPTGTDGQMVQESINAIGGRVLSEPKPIPIEEISPDFLANFLKAQKPGLNFVRDPEYVKLFPSLNYSEVFPKLRTLPPEEQEKLLIKFFTQEVENFPNGELFGKRLARINNIPLKPSEELDPSSLQLLAGQVRICLNLESLPIKIIKDDWLKTWQEMRRTEWWKILKTALRATEPVAREAGRTAVWHQAFSLGWDATRRGITEMGIEAEETGSALMVWTIVEDLMPEKGYSKGNPFESLSQIYALGCWPIGELPTQEFAIFILPPKAA